MVKKILVKLLLITLLLTLALDINGVGIKTVKGSGTYVGGIISEDTVWTLENSPYILTKHILVQENVSLIIESGVEIRLDGHFIQVDGTLQALGEPERPINIIDSILSEVKILFTEKSRPWNEEEKTGCLIKFARVEGSSHYGLVKTTSGASPKITNSFLINPAGPALYVTGWSSPSITYCTIKSWGGVFCFDGAAEIVGNIIESAYPFLGELVGDGIFVGSWAGTNIERNIIHKFRRGLVVGSYMRGENTSNSIVANLVTGNKVGFSFLVTNNIGFFVPSRLEIFHNSIYNNTEWDVYLNTEPIWDSDVNMTQNWWGTTDLKAIKAKIYDFEQDFRVGRVLVEPFLTEPHPNTPTLSEVQPTPTTTSSSSPTISSTSTLATVTTTKTQYYTTTLTQTIKEVQTSVSRETVTSLNTVTATEVYTSTYIKSFSESLEVVPMIATVALITFAITYFLSRRRIH